MSSSTKKITAGVLAVLVILFSLGFRVGHAQDGLKNALGSAKSGLVVYKNKPSFTVGSKVLVNLDAPAPSPLLAFVMGNKAETVEIQAGTTVQSVKSSQVYGTLIAVIPFLGSIRDKGYLSSSSDRCHSSSRSSSGFTSVPASASSSPRRPKVKLGSQEMLTLSPTLNGATPSSFCSKTMSSCPQGIIT